MRVSAACRPEAAGRRPLPSAGAGRSGPAAGGLAFSVRPRSGTAVGRLSERELDVVRLVVDGRSNDEIGARLGIGPKTVESHLRRIFARFDLASRTELATRALREGWLDVPPA